ncbi:hypothetical protein [Pendulispora albinea]|uniref:Uncharacterized protein n=1 Tax=Pendulispora albinea TaxID=2741071 RepID=A0ABZ2LY27_9BACT
MGVARHVWGTCFLLSTLAAGDALADRAPSQGTTSQGTGLAVFAGRDAADAAWPLAQQVYARPSLRPPALDEARARVLAGEAPASDAPAALRDLADTRDAIRGDDAPSRQLLASIAHQLHVRGLVVVTVPAPNPLSPSPTPTPVARIFLADAGIFDAASYAPDPVRTAPDAKPAAGTKTAWVWSGAVGSLERSYGNTAPASEPRGALSEPAAASKPTQTAPTTGTTGNTGQSGDAKTASKPFYASPWFWGAIAAAAVGGVGIFIATRDGSDDRIHLQMQVPR